MVAGPNSQAPKFSMPKPKSPREMSTQRRQTNQLRRDYALVKAGKKKPQILAGTVVSPVGGLMRIASAVIKSRTPTANSASKTMSNARNAKTTSRGNPSTSMAPKQKVGINPVKYAKRYKEQGQDLISARGQNFRNQVKVNRTPDNTDGPVPRNKIVKGKTAMAARTYSAKAK